MAKYRIVMHRGTVIDADHMSPMYGHPNNLVWLVGIGLGNGRTYQSHCSHPQPHPDFWIVEHTKPYQPNSCKFWRGGEVPTWSEWDEATGEDIGDPKPDGHTDWIITPKFQKIITMHTKNIKSINGKPVLYVDDSDTLERGRGHLDIDESWSINKISDLLEE